MDLTPRLLTEVEFREEWRGYKREDVDEFLARIATAVGELQEQLREAVERASAAERRLLDRSDEDEIRRTLVLAQRTAATAVEEARAEAQQILEEAHRRASEQVADAEQRLSSLESELAERTRVELGELAERKQLLQADVDALRVFEEEHRERLRAELQRQLASLDEPGALTVPEPPEVSEADGAVADAVADLELPVMEPPAVTAFAGPEVRQPTEDEVAQAREDLVEALRRAGIEDLADLEPAPGSADEALVSTAFQPEGEEQGENDVAATAPALFDDDAEWSGDELPVDAGPPTAVFDVLADDEEAPVDAGDAGDAGIELQWRDAEEVEGIDEPGAAAESATAEPVAADTDHGAGTPPPEPDIEDDPFLAELRRAVTDTEPLGPRDDDDVPGIATRDADAVPSGRFRLRRGR